MFMHQSYQVSKDKARDEYFHACLLLLSADTSLPSTQPLQRFHQCCTSISWSRDNIMVRSMYQGKCKSTFFWQSLEEPLVRTGLPAVKWCQALCPTSCMWTWILWKTILSEEQSESNPLQKEGFDTTESSSSDWNYCLCTWSAPGRKFSLFCKHFCIYMQENIWTQKVWPSTIDAMHSPRMQWFQICSCLDSSEMHKDFSPCAIRITGLASATFSSTPGRDEWQKQSSTGWLEGEICGYKDSVRRSR